MKNKSQSKTNEKDSTRPFYDDQTGLERIIMFSDGVMAIAFIPFPTRVLIENGNLISTTFYALRMTMIGLLSALLYFFAFHNNRLIEPPLDDRSIHRKQVQSLLTPGVFLLSVGLAFIKADLAKNSWALLSLMVYALR